VAKRFRFNLQTVLRCREIRETERKKEFGLANRAVEETRMQRESLQADRETVRDDIRGLYADKAGFSRILDAYRYGNAVDLALARNARNLAHLEAVRDEKREVLVAARRDRRAMEMLKEKRRKAHEDEAVREEQSALDELAIAARRRAMARGDDR